MQGEKPARELASHALFAQEPSRQELSAEDLSPHEQSVALTSTFRLIQPKRGHRYSVDDMLVAYIAAGFADAAEAAGLGGEPRRVLDLGTGLGSVLLMLAWRFPRATFVGVEAQPEHAAWARRNVRLNGCEDRVTILQGDLRHEDVMQQVGDGFDLVTGTPPYFDPARSTVCSHRLRAYAQWELRGGIEHYVQAASRAMADHGAFVVCSAARPEQRTPRALAAWGLRPTWCQQVVPRTGRPPFLTLWVARKQTSSAVHSHTICPPFLVLRTDQGLRTQQHMDIRQSFGIACSLK